MTTNKHQHNATPVAQARMIPAIHFQRCDIKLLCPKVPLDQAKG